MELGAVVKIDFEGLPLITYNEHCFLLKFFHIGVSSVLQLFFFYLIGFSRLI